MVQRKIVPFAPRPAPMLDDPIGASGLTGFSGHVSVTYPGASKDVKEVDQHLQTDLAIEKAEGAKAALGQFIVEALYHNGLQCQNRVFIAAFTNAKAIYDEDAQAYALGAAHQASVMVNEDISDITRIGAAQVKQVQKRSTAPVPKEPRWRGWR